MREGQTSRSSPGLCCTSCSLLQANWEQKKDITIFHHLARIKYPEKAYLRWLLLPLSGGHTQLFPTPLEQQGPPLGQEGKSPKPAAFLMMCWNGHWNTTQTEEGGLPNYVTEADCAYVETHICSWVNRIPNGKHRKQEERQENSGFLCLGTELTWTVVRKCSLIKCHAHSGLGSFANIIFKYIWLWINGIHRALI